MPSRAHAARLGLRGFGGVDLPDAAERATALRWASILRRISRTLGSVVCSAASAHALAKRRYLERVSMSMMGTLHFLLALDLRSFARMARNRGSSRHALLRQVNQEAT